MNEVIVIRGRTEDECVAIQKSLVNAGSRCVVGAQRVAFTTGAGPYILVVECLTESS